MTYTDTNMDHARDLSRFGQENPHVPSSPELDDLFDAVFDYPALLGSVDPWEKQHYRASPQHLNQLITEINPLLQDLDRLESHRFFSMPTFPGSDDGAVTTPDYSGHPSPPELVQGEGSTSPSDHSGPAIPEYPEEVYRRSDISLGDFRTHDDKWTYPQADPSRSSRGPYVHQLRVSGHGVSRYADKGPGNKVSSGRNSAKRQRQLENPDQTADVRKSGACLPCRMTKTRCHENGVCPTCRQAFPDHSHMVCARKSLIDLWPVIARSPDVFSKNPAKEAAYCSEAQRIFIGKSKQISVFFSKDSGSPAFTAYVHPYRWADEAEGSQLEKISLSKEHFLDNARLVNWVEQQIHHERGSDFPRTVQRFLMLYARYGRGLPKHSLVVKVHEMACYFRIWKTAGFWCRDPSGKVAALPLSVQAQLRVIARRAISGIECDILKALDSLTSASSQPKTEERSALWACLWQLMLMYREITAASEAWSAHSEQNSMDHQQNPYQIWYRFLSESFFPLLSIFYHYQFRTKKHIEISMDWMDKSSKYAVREGKSIYRAGQAMLDCRKHFLQKLQSSDSDVDRLLCAFVVNHELKKLSARKRASKSSKSRISAHGDDDCDGDAD